MTVLLIVLALGRRYPYGGPLRHQFFVFPFAVVVLALVVDEAAARSRRLAPLAAALLALAAAVNAANWIGDFRIVRGYLQQAQMDRFRAAFPAPEAVFVDQYNFVTLFMHHHDRPWRLERWRPGEERIDVWRVGGDGERGFSVCRDNRSWQFDLSSHYTFNRMRLCLQATGARRATVFRPQQKGTTAAWPVAETEALAAAAAARAGLAPETVVVEGEDVYATFTRRR
jgi:hypothetical protein